MSYSFFNFFTFWLKALFLTVVFRRLDYVLHLALWLKWRVTYGLAQPAQAFITCFGLDPPLPSPHLHSIPLLLYPRVARYSCSPPELLEMRKTTKELKRMIGSKNNNAKSALAISELKLKEYENSLNFLHNNGLIYKCYKLNEVKSPLSTNKDKTILLITSVLSVGNLTAVYWLRGAIHW